MQQTDVDHALMTVAGQHRQNQTSQACLRRLTDCRTPVHHAAYLHMICCRPSPQTWQHVTFKCMSPPTLPSHPF